MPWDTIESAKFDRLDLVAPYQQELRRRSTNRVATDKEYSYIREDIEMLKKQQADKTVSLNEKQRLKEKEEIDARNKARDKERLARAEPTETLYDLTLKQAALPGLPPPTVRTNSTVAKLTAPKGAGVSSLSTNGTVASANEGAAGSDSDEESLDEKPAALDAALDESEHILVDYLSLLPKGNLVTAGHVSNLQ